MAQTLELLLDRRGERLLLCSPEVGHFTSALPAGAWIGPRARVGVLHSLARRYELLAPAGATGQVVSTPPERVLAPVDYGAVLYELEPLRDAAAAEAREEPGSSDAALVLRAPYSGRFWHRPTPSDPPFVSTGATLSEGQALGMIEVMKTFTQLVYRAEGGLPARARVLRVVVPDGGEVKDGGALLELEAL